MGDGGHTCTGNWTVWAIKKVVRNIIGYCGTCSISNNTTIHRLAGHSCTGGGVGVRPNPPSG